MILLLGGTSEGRDLAARLAKAGLPAVASLAGATRAPAPLGLETRSGGFGGEAGFRHYLAARGISAIVDATHPFAARITARSARIAQDLWLPYLLLLRPSWVPEPDDDWHMMADEAAIAGLIPSGSTVFLATGRQTLGAFTGLSGCRLICRQIDPPDGPFPFPNGKYLLGRPPFSVEDEVALFKRLGIDWLVVKNAGGAASATKLVAARVLDIPVAMIERPTPPECATVATVEEAMEWIQKTCRN